MEKSEGFELFEEVNKDKEKLNYEIDLHYQKVKEAKEKF